MEGLPVSQDSIENGEKLASNGDEGEPSGLSGVDEGFEEGLETGCVAGRDEGGDIERIAHAFAAAADRSLATSCSAVVVEGGESRQGGELLGRASAEFGHEGEQDRGSDRADTRDGSQKAAVVFEVRLGCCRPGDLRLEGFDRRVKPGEMGRKALLRD